jgi:HSP20 family protein
MNFVRWNPLNEMSLLQNHMNRLFDTALQSWPGDSNGTTQWTPAADIYEAENELVVNLDLPGVDPKMIDIRVENSLVSKICGRFLALGVCRECGREPVQ